MKYSTQKLLVSFVLLWLPSFPVLAEPPPNLCALGQLIRRGGAPDKNVKHVAEQFERGLDNPDIVMYHGMSLEVLAIAIKTGRIPAGYVTEGNLYFAPATERANFPVDPKFDNASAQELASGYASDLASENQFLAELEMPHSKEAGNAYVRLQDHLVREQALEYYYARGYTRDQVLTALAASENQKGVVIGVHKRALEHYRGKVTEGDPGEGDVKVSVGEGMPIEFISGINTEGEKEYEFMEALQVYAEEGGTR